MRPRALISLCCCGVPCRYHGLTHKMGHRLYKEKIVARLADQYELIPVCPEIMGGLPTPRCPCSVEWDGSEPLVKNRQTGTILEHGVNLTDAYVRGAEWSVWMAEVFDARVAYLLKKSPACDPANGVAARALTANGVLVRGL